MYYQNTHRLQNLRACTHNYTKPTQYNLNKHSTSVLALLVTTTGMWVSTKTVLRYATRTELIFFSNLKTSGGIGGIKWRKYDVKDQELHTQWQRITTQKAEISNATAVRATDYWKRGFCYLIIIVFMGNVAYWQNRSRWCSVVNWLSEQLFSRILRLLMRL
jgi:hypothetical protein